METCGDMPRGTFFSTLKRGIVVSCALGVFISSCARPARFGSDARAGRYGSRAGPEVVRRKPGAAVLVGSASSSPGSAQRSGARGVIVAVDGHRLERHNAASEISVAAGCHIIEAKFTYKMIRSDRSGKCSLATGMTGVIPQGFCDDVTEYRSGRQYFAIPIRSGERYEFAAHISNDAVQVYFAEVDPTLGTVARHFPVKYGTRTCARGVPVGGG